MALRTDIRSLFATRWLRVRLSVRGFFLPHFITSPTAAATAKELYDDLVRRLTVLLYQWSALSAVLIGIPTWIAVYVQQTATPLTFELSVYRHLIVFGIGLVLVRRRYYQAALTLPVVTDTVMTLVGAWVNQDTGYFIFVFMPLILPAIVLSVRAMMAILIIVHTACLGIALRIGGPAVALGISLLIVSDVIFLSVLWLSAVVRRALVQFAVAVDARESETLDRLRVERESVLNQTRLEERLEVVDEHASLLLSAHHDLRHLSQFLFHAALELQVAHDQRTPTLAAAVVAKANALRTRLDAMFDVARARSPEVPKQRMPLDLVRTVVDAVPHLEELAIGTGYMTENQPFRVKVEHHGPTETIYGREGEVLRILENLVYNSVKARAQQLWIRIHAEPNGIEMVIDDDGVGFPKSILAHQARVAYSEHREGSGFGLPSVVVNARLLGAQVTLENWESGARVTLRFTRPRSEA